MILAAASDIFEAMLIPPSFPGEEGKKAAAADSKSSSGKSGLGLGGLDEDDRPTIGEWRASLVLLTSCVLVRAFPARCRHSRCQAAHLQDHAAGDLYVAAAPHAVLLPD